MNQKTRLKPQKTYQKNQQKTFKEKKKTCMLNQMKTQASPEKDYRQPL